MLVQPEPFSVRSSVEPNARPGPTGRPRSELRPLTGLRGLAALVVIVYHFAQPYDALGIDTHFSVRQGYLSVDSFYMLSGFVMAYNYGNWFRDGIDLGRYGKFLLRRVARLYPAYLAIALVMLAKTMVNLSGNHALGHYSLYDYVLNFLMLTGWGLNVYPLIADSWSVSAELFAYLLFPALVLLAVLGTARVAIVVAVAAAICIAAVTRSGLGVQGPLDVVSSDSFYPLLRCVTSFTFGLLSYRIANIEALRPRLASDAACAIVIAMLAAVWVLRLPDLALYACLPALVTVLSFESRLACLACANRFLYHLGVVSYSLYLLHPMFVTIVVRLARIGQDRFGLHDIYWPLALLGMAAAMGLATLSYRLIEAPGRRWVETAALRLVPARVA